MLELRARRRAQVRAFFEARNVLEIEAPVLVAAAGADPHVPVTVVTPHAEAVPRFLHTSPEHAMKRLLCAGSGDIYFLGPVFRDGECGRYHNPEFTMIEWYRLGFDHLELARETVELLRLLLGDSGQDLARHEFAYSGLVAECTGLDLAAADAKSLADLCRAHGVDVPANLDLRGLRELLFATVVTPAMPAGIVVVRDYPADQAALARIRPGPWPVAERFEVFVNGLELANGFFELADAREQRARFDAERQRYEATGRVVPPQDEHLLAALEHGLPDCAGVALGFDRAIMLAAGVDELARVMPFSYERA